MSWLGLLIAGAAGGFIIGLWAGLRWAVVSACRPFEGEHAWGPWSEPYPAGQHGLWQQRRCQCGNRDFRRAR